MKTAIWCAVSSAAQAAPDKVSIQLQQQKGREFIKARGYTPAGEFIVPGESRTRYISLYHAEKNIPALRELLEAAQRREFDLLWVYDLNRFRHLMRQVFDALCDYGVQLYIHTNPREPVPPESYSKEHQNAVGMIVDLANIISRSEISNIQRHFREKMPERIKKGLDGRLGGIPYGYKKIHPLDKFTPLILDEPKASVVIRIKDWFLAGKSLKEIARLLNAEHTPAPEGGVWYPQSVRNVLTKPIYAGIVYFGRTQTNLDRRTGVKKVSPSPEPTYAKGLHPALYDQTTYQRIQDQIENRGNGYKGEKTRRFSGLLHCGVCGKVLHSSRFSKNEYGRFWQCSSKTAGHTFITERKVIEIAIPEIIAGIKNLKRIPIKKDDHDPAEKIRAEIADLERRHKKWMDTYEDSDDDTFDKTEVRARMQEIKKRLNTARGRLAQTQAAANKQAASRQIVNELAQLIDHLDVYLTEAPAPQANAFMRSLIEKVSISKDHKVKIEWR